MALQYLVAEHDGSFGKVVTPYGLGHKPGGGSGDLYETDLADMVHAAQAGGAKVLYLTEGRYTWNKVARIYTDGFAIIGEHPEAVELRMAGRACFAPGLAETVPGADLPVAHWVNISPYMDATVVAARYGWRTHLAAEETNDGKPHFAHLSAPISPFALGRRQGDWRYTESFTFTLAIVSREADGQWPKGTYVHGGEGRHTGSPLTIWRRGDTGITVGTMRIVIGTGPPHDEQQHQWEIALPTPPGESGVLRWLTIHANPTTGTIEASVDGIYATVTPFSVGSQWGQAGTRFTGRKFGTFCLGAAISQGAVVPEMANNAGTPGSGEYQDHEIIDGKKYPRTDITFAGCHLAIGRRFAPGSAGSALSWATGGPEAVALGSTTDLRHSEVFFGLRSNTMALYDFTQGQGSTDFRVRVGTGTGASLGHARAWPIGRKAMDIFGNIVQTFEVADLKINYLEPYSCPFQSFGVWDAELRRVRANNAAAVTWADLGAFATYSHIISQCHLNSWYDSITTITGTWLVEKCRGGYDRSIISARGTNLTVRDASHYPYDITREQVHVFGHYEGAAGGNLHFEGNLIDYEADRGNSVYYVEAVRADGFSGTSLYINSPITYYSNMTSGVLLKASNNANPKANVNIVSGNVGGASNVPHVKVWSDPNGAWGGDVTGPRQIATLLDHPDPEVSASQFRPRYAGEPEVWTPEQRDGVLTSLTTIATATEAASIQAAIFSKPIDGGTFEQAMQVIAAEAAGDIDESTPGQTTIKGFLSDVDRITATWTESTRTVSPQLDEPGEDG